jgi:hypothetical protein
LLLEYGAQHQTAVFTPQTSTQTFRLSPPGVFAHFNQFLREGTWHIWHGYDHILFLLALLIPAVLQWDKDKWSGTPTFRPALLNVLKIVTAFTIAHSVTLSLAALDVVRLPSRFIESTIALSVAIAAANNFRPFFRESAWKMAFTFGLIHGFGFANALTELGSSHGTLAVTLLAFNLGVEIGQLAIVAAFLPLAFALRNTAVYRPVFISAGSSVIVACALLWLVDRAFVLGFMPF